MLPLRMARASFLAFVSSTPTSRTFMTTTMLHASSAPPPPVQYILSYTYVADVLEQRAPHREQHLALAKELCLSGGPTASLNDAALPTGALFIFKDVQAAESFVQQDPYVSAGIVTDHSIEAWTVAIQN